MILFKIKLSIKKDDKKQVVKNFAQLLITC